MGTDEKYLDSHQLRNPSQEKKRTCFSREKWQKCKFFNSTFYLNCQTIQHYYFIRFKPHFCFFAAFFIVYLPFECIVIFYSNNNSFYCKRILTIKCSICFLLLFCRLLCFLLLFCMSYCCISCWKSTNGMR